MIITDTLDVMEGQEEDEEEEEFVDVEENRRKLKKALETILVLDFPLDELDQKVHRRLGQKLQAIHAEELKSI
ncbi:hypothetical protein A0J61_10235 [Choanephora cucurbitarum]|uniref:Uncharacterized protein n=1 Tax=Choanephora cucurbitarum TaxID=101091 RepID=A0A1C7MY44_9FUNG|nr:hypothetical protein A0J61_10235 [Choanephora cucurbitarum]